MRAAQPRSAFRSSRFRTPPFVRDLVGGKGGGRGLAVVSLYGAGFISDSYPGHFSFALRRPQLAASEVM
jgi:hypothetical protein